MNIKHRFLTSCLLVLAAMPRLANLQLEAPPTDENDDVYQPPNLSRGLGTVSDATSQPRRRYPDRSNQRSQSSNYDPGSDFRGPPPQQQQQSPQQQQQQQQGFSYDPHGPYGYPVNNASSGFGQQPPQPQRTTQRPPQQSRGISAPAQSRNSPDPGPQPRSSDDPRISSEDGEKRDPFDDPNRYRVPQQHEVRDGVKFVNGRPYREPPNVQDRYGNRYDPRFHSIPGQYDPENDPRFSDPRYSDPRNLPKYNENRQKVPKDRYDSKYRYYERFPDRQRDRLRDPNYDPRYDPDDPPVPGVLGGWLPELQGECRPGCENLPRDVHINTNYGRVNGFLVYLYDGPRVPEFDRPGVANVDKIKATVSVFLGVPYAQAPVGEARLMPPRPHRGWQSYAAVDWAPVCPQPVRYVGATKNAPLMDEDCLYLNIYTPTVKSGQSQLFPVMFYIHGGEFIHGSGNEFPGHQLAAWGQTVVVTVNYRLGALGFLSTGDHHAPGNYGLLDVAIALKWTHDNINSFQGDRDRITVFGPDAGAATAGLLAVMPRSRHHVRRVISISGSPLADWAAFGDKFRAMNTSMVFGERVGCTIESSWKLVDCLRRGRSFAELTNVEFKPEYGTWPWAPVVQKNISVPNDEWYEEWTSDDFMALPELVEVLYETQQYSPKLQYMTGVARDDASYLIYENKTLAPGYNIGWDFFDTMVWDHISQYNYTLNQDGIFNAIKYMYTYYPDPNNVSHIREEFVNFWSDYYFKAPQDALVKQLVRNRVDTFMYVQNTTVEALRLPYWRQITHNLEHYFLSGAPFMDPVFFPEDQQISRHLWTEGDRNMSEFFIYAVSNFSWYGHPTPKNILGVHWDMTVPGEIMQYLAVNTTENSTTLWNYRQRECAFWTEYLPSVILYVTPTYPPTTEFWWEPDSPLQIAFWTVASVCLALIVLVVVCCLLWRNAERKVKDLSDWPEDASQGGGYAQDGQSILTDRMMRDAAFLPQDNPASPEVASLHKSASFIGSQAPIITNTGTIMSGGSVLNSLPPQTPIMGVNANGSMASTVPLGMMLPPGSYTQQQQGIPLNNFPQQTPLPPPPHHQGGLRHTASTNSLLGQDGLPLVPQPKGNNTSQPPSPGPSRRTPLLHQQQTTDSSDWSDPPPQQVHLSQQQQQQPMGVPRSQVKLVPGRMSSGHMQRQGSQGSVRRTEIPSTAV